MQQTPNIGLIIIGDEVLSGKRQDKHFSQSISILTPLGLSLSWVKIVGDDATLLTNTLKESFKSNDIVFCFGGIGATPDDRTRQSAARALNLPLVRHIEAVKEIEAEFGADAYPQRIRMAEYPQGADIIPNFYNRVPGFSIANHHFMPGFPMMAKPMMEWVINQYYSQYIQAPTVERAIKIMNGQESEWVEFMIEFEQRFPSLRLFSLPTILADDSRVIELGVEGDSEMVDIGIAAIMDEAKRRQSEWLMFKGGT